MRRLAMLAPIMLAVGLSGVAVAQPSIATVTVLHGLPAFTADVYVNGELTLDGFEPLDSTDPFELAPGEYTIEIRDVGAEPDSPPALEATAAVEGGKNVSLVPHLSADGEPSFTIFPNNLSQVRAGEGRFVARHVAAAPGLDILVDGSALFTALENGDESAARLSAGSHTLAVTRAGSSEPLASPLDFTLREGTAQMIYVVGSIDQSLDVMTQTITELQSPPGAVTTGDGGQADRGGRSPLMIGAMALFGAGAVLSAAVALAVRRRQTSGS
jgi:hypothetical protein